MPHTIRVIARSKNEVQLKLYMDRGVYEELARYSQALCISPVDLVRMVIAERFPDAPSMELRVGPDIEGVRAPKPLTDGRPDQCRNDVGAGAGRVIVCGHTWGEHNYDAQGNELPDGGPCLLCKCPRFV